MYKVLKTFKNLKTGNILEKDTLIANSHERLQDFIKAGVVEEYFENSKVDTEEDTTGTKEEKIDFRTLKKDALIELCKEKGIEIDSKDTKDELIDLLEKAE